MYIASFILFTPLGECESSADLRDTSDGIAEVIGSSMISIASHLYAKSILTETEYDIISDPSAEHSTTVTRAILTAVRKAIAADPNHLETFKGILVDEGEPISSLARMIG